MKHPTSIELVDFRQGKLPPEQALDIEHHIADCDICSRECNELAVIETHIAAWKDPPVSETLVADTMRILQLSKTVPDLNLTGNLNDGWRGNLWFRRIVLAAGAVAATLLLQVLVWNPLATPTKFRAIINLIQEAFALTSEQAVPDTILVLTLHPDNTFSTSLLTGQYELEDLITEMGDLVETGRFKELLIVGTDVDNPVNFRTEKLQPLLENLGIDSFTIGTGVVALDTARELTATMALPLRLDISSFRFSADSLYSRPFEFLSPTIDFTILQPQTFLSPLSLEIKPHLLRLTPTVGITPSRIGLITRAYPAEVLLADLLSPSQAILTVNTDGNILIDRAVVQEGEFERALRRLQLLNPEISLLILIREDAGPDDPGYKMMEIAKRFGMSVSVKKVKEP